MTAPCCIMKRATLLLLILCSNAVTSSWAWGQTEDDGQQSPDASECSILHLFPFSSFVMVQPDEAITRMLAMNGYSLMASVDMAIRHFNERNPAVVSDLTLLTQGCNSTLSTFDVVDSKFDGRMSIINIIQKFENTTDGASCAAETSNTQARQPRRRPCAVIGPEGGANVREFHVIATAYDMLHMLYSCPPPTTDARTPTSPFKADDENLHLTADQLDTDLLESRLKTKPPPHGKVTVVSVLPAHQGVFWVPHVLRYLSSGQNNFLAVMAQSMPFDSLHPANELAKGGKAIGFQVSVKSSEPFKSMLNSIRQSGYRTIFPSVQLVSDYIQVAKDAEALGMLEGGSYLYILDPKRVKPRDVAAWFGEHRPGSTMDKFLTGAMIVDYIDGYEKVDSKDKLLRAWRDQGPDIVKHLNEMTPTSQLFQGTPDYFQSHLPSQFSSFVYDAVISLGLAVCQATAGRDTRNLADSGSSSNTTAPSQQDSRLSADQIREAFSTTVFEGASGPIAYNAPFFARNTSVPVGIYNIRAVHNELSGKNSYEAVLVSYSIEDEKSSAVEKAFVQVPGEAFVYRDGSTAPKGYRVFMDENFLSKGVRIFGLVMMGACWTLSIGAIFFIVRWREHNLVRLGQPLFLILVCVGSILLSASIFTISWDENAGWSEHALDVACMMTPWLFFVGYVITFTAIACKLWRLDKVLRTRRRSITSLQSIGPLLLLLVLTISILIVWTLVDPWVWDRTVIDEIKAESYGRCTCEHWWAYFAPLMVLLVSAESLAGYYAAKTVVFPNNLSESGPVFYAIMFHIQSWIVGLPVLVVIDDASANATYVGRVALVWIFAVSSVAFVVLPRLCSVAFPRRHARQEQAGESASRRLNFLGSQKRIFLSGLDYSGTPSIPACPERKEDSGVESSVRARHSEVDGMGLSVRAGGSEEGADGGLDWSFREGHDLSVWARISEREEEQSAEQKAHAV